MIVIMLLLVFFLLYYTKDSTMTKVSFTSHSIKDILMMRNKIAKFLQYRLKEINELNETDFD